MRPVFVSLFLIAACGEVDDSFGTASEVEAFSDLPVEAAPPVPTPALLSVTAMSIGQTITFTLQGVAPGARSVFLATGNLAAPGVCPPAIAPACTDMPAGAVTLGTVFADANGVATLSLTVPPQVPAQAEFQAYATVPGVVYLSNAVVRNLVPAGDTCTGNPQWQPVDCMTTMWVWSSDRAYLTVPDAAAAQSLYTGCAHGGVGNTCSLDGQGWVSTQVFTMSGCDADWYHIGPGYTGNCGGHDGDQVRLLAPTAADCYAY